MAKTVPWPSRWPSTTSAARSLGKPIELLSADHQNKADIAATKAREWIDTQGLTMLFGGTNSGTALAMAKIADEKKRVFMVNGAGWLGTDQRAVHALHRSLRL